MSYASQHHTTSEAQSFFKNLSNRLVGSSSAVAPPPSAQPKPRVTPPAPPVGMAAAAAASQQLPLVPASRAGVSGGQLQASTASPAPATRSHMSMGAGVSALMTQATQQQTPPQQQSPQGARSVSAEAAAAVTGGRSKSGAPAGASSAVTKVSHSAVVERVRHLRQQPKNTSPIDASRHPSLLPPQLPAAVGKKCLILDVDETLVHSSYQPTHHYDLHLPLRVNGGICNVYVGFRPYLLEFLRAVSPIFEVVIFTASVSIYCDPLMDHVDRHKLLGPLRLFREHCSVVNGSFVKDLSLLGRPLDTAVIIDNSPVAYLFQQRNAIPITSWFDDPHDDELLRLIPVLEEVARAPTVYDVLDGYNAHLQLLGEAQAAQQQQQPAGGGYR